MDTREARTVLAEISMMAPDGSLIGE